METPDLDARVIQLLVHRLGLPAEEIRPESRLVDDLGMDSLDALELAIATERQFQVAVSDEQMAKLVTVADLLALVRELVAQAGQVAAGGA